MAGPRKGELVSIPLGPGILSNTTPRGAKSRINYTTWDRWRDASWVRWHKLLAEKQAGWAYQALVDGNSNGTTYLGLARGLHDWASIDGQFWIAIGTHLKLYLVNNLVLFDITPMRRTSNVMNALSTSNGSHTVTVTDLDHRANTGDYITISGASAVGGLTLNGQFPVTVIDPDTYTITAVGLASSTATGGGSFSITYDIYAGLPSNGELLGYGTGRYGELTYGTPRAVGTGVFARLRSWSLDNYGQDLIASYSDGEIYYWTRNSGPNTRAALIADAPTGCQRVIVDAVQRIVIALGCTDVTSAFDAMLVRWSDIDGPDVWVPTATNLAGDFLLSIGSRIVTGIRTKGQNLIWTDTHLYRMVFVGGNDVYSFYPAGVISIVGPNAAIDVDGTAFCMAFDNFYTYSGTLQILPSEVWETVFDPHLSTSLLKTQAEKVFCFSYETKSEITWLYPSLAGSGENDRYVTYNWDDEVWYFGAWTRTAAQGRSQAMGGYPYGVNAGFLYKHEIGTDAIEQAGTLAIPFYMESLDITVGGAKGEFTMGGSDARFAIGGSDAHLLVRSMIPDFAYLTGAMNITLKTKDRPMESTYVVDGPVAFDNTTTQVDIDAHGSQIVIRFDSYTGMAGAAGLGSAFRMGIFQALAVPYAKR